MVLVREVDNFERDNITLKIYDLNERDMTVQTGWFEIEDRGEVIASGMFYASSAQELDSDEVLYSLLIHLSNAPGEVNGPSENEYSREQITFLKDHMEMFGEYAMELLGE